MSDEKTAKTKATVKTDEEQKPEKPLIPKDTDPNTIITVRNGFQGRLVYRSRKTGELFIWDEFGSEQDMELGELKNAKSSGKKFFINNWFMFDEPWVVEYLGMSQYYKYAISLDHFDDLFTMSPAELEKKISKLSAGQKQSVAYRARQLIAEGEIDSNKVITTLEKSLGVDLIDRDR